MYSPRSRNNENTYSDAGHLTLVYVKPDVALITVRLVKGILDVTILRSMLYYFIKIAKVYTLNPLQ